MPWLAWSVEEGEADAREGPRGPATEAGVAAYALVQEPIRRLSSLLGIPVGPPRTPLEAQPMGGAKGGAVSP